MADASTVLADPAANQSVPNWNSLKVGQILNGGAVLDANTFRNAIVSKYDGSTNGVAYSGLNEADSDKLGATLGRKLSDDAYTQVYGFKPVDFSSPGGTGESTSGTAWDTEGLKKAATAAGIDTSKYVIKGSDSGYNGGEDGPQIVQDGLDSERLQKDTNAALFNQAASNPNALFQIDSQVHTPGASPRDRNVTYYTQRGDRLIPVQAPVSYRQAPGPQETARGVGTVLAAAFGAYLGPTVSAYFGGGTAGAAGAGAAMGALNSGINGGNVLKGAVVGGVTGGVGSAATTAVSGATGSDLLGKIAGGASTGAVSGIAGGGKNLGSDIISGAIGGAGSYYGTGGNLVASIIKRQFRPQG